jgi:LuxR family transcriptional regulator, maltose regulon positive regulatory protein
VVVGTFDVIESKLLVPSPRPESVSRTALVNRLRATGGDPVVVLVAPAGYGKTTLLSQWAVRDVRPFAWVSIDERDNDSFVLLRHIAAAVDRVEPIDALAADALRRPDGSIWDAAMPRLTAYLAACESPFVLVLDDVDLLESKEAVSAVATLIQNIPPASLIVLAGRVLPKLAVAALRADGPLLEIGARELALSRREAELLLRSSGVELDENETDELIDRTEGWAAGLHLAALAAREEDSRLGERLRVASVNGADRYLADYVRSEYLSGLSPDLLRFLRRSSVLEKMCRPLCDAVLESKGLEAIEKANLFLVPLDRQREWYRYHHLFRDLLLRELEDEEPDLVPVLHRRAAEWYEAHGDPESALGHAHACGDYDGAARILSSIALRVHHSGRVAAVEDWLDRFDDDERLERYPAVAIHGCRIHALRGRPQEAKRWLDAAERGAAARRKGVASVRPWIAVMRSAMCSDGPERMQRDAKSALAKLSQDETWRPSALLVEGAAAILLGDDDRADSILAEAAVEAERLGANETHAVAVGERSLLAAARDDQHGAEELAFEAHHLVEDNELDDYATSALALAASARALLRHGLWEKARRQLTLAEKLVPSLTYALPWLAVQVRVELGHAYVTLRDREGALRLLAEAGEITALKPELGVLSDDIDALADEIGAMPRTENGNSGLTAAELRLLPLLSTHLSFREIGERLYVSRNTIKTQAISVYRKLGVSSRSEAIARAGELGLVEASDQVVAGSPPAVSVRSAAL